MNSTLSKMLMFATGAAIGSVVTWKLVSTKYAQIANEEIESMRDYYAEKSEKQQSDDTYGEETEDDDTEARSEYEAIVRGEGYAEAENKDDEEDTKMEVDDSKPYVISPEDFDESDYTTETLEYYEGDDVLVDAYGDVIENREEVVGTDFTSHFGENKNDGDTVYVRNDEQEMDYEICRDLRSYSEVY